VTIQVLARLGGVWFFGASSLFGLAVATGLAWLGLRGRPRVNRRRAQLVVSIVAGGLLLAVAGAALSGALARSDLAAGNRADTEGIRLLAEGEVGAAANAFGVASAAFARAQAAVERPWAQPGSFVPVVAQHLDASTSVADSAANAADQLGPHPGPDRRELPSGRRRED
jgi:hypothetical protein